MLRRWRTLRIIDFLQTGQRINQPKPVKCQWLFELQARGDERTGGLLRALSEKKQSAKADDPHHKANGTMHTDAN